MQSTVALRWVAVIQELTQARDRDQLFEILGRATRELMAADGATLVLRDGQCRPRADETIGPLWEGNRFSLTACVGDWVMQNRAPVAIENVPSDPRLPLDAGQSFVKSLVLVPIRQRDPLAAIGGHWAETHPVSAADLQALQALADCAGLAMENFQSLADLEQRLRERDAALESAHRDLDAFSYSVSHDLRAPVRHLSGFAELLAASGGCNEQALLYARRIESAAARANAMIDDMLRLSRVSAREMHRRPVDLSVLAREVADALTCAHPDRKVNVEIAPGLTAEGDSGLLRIVLENLLGNAWKFTARTPDARIAFGAVGNAAGEFYLADNGVGFAMETAERLFQPFARLHPENEFEGNGMGLAIVRRILRKHGGSIRAESAPRRGATFYFTVS